MKFHRAEKYDRAVVVAKKALEVVKENACPDHPGVATSLNALAVLYKAQGHHAQAEPLYKRAVALQLIAGNCEFYAFRIVAEDQELGLIG